MRRSVALLLLLGLLRMAGDAFGSEALYGLGFASAASPGPKVFTVVGDMEPFANRFFLSWDSDSRGVSREDQSIALTPAVYSRLEGPYNRRNTYSAATKLASPSWLDGNALRFILENPLARDSGLRLLLLQLPDALLRLGSWGILGLELLALPLALSSRCRPWLWATFVALHLSLLVLIDFADLTFGMILLHLFTFDPAWIRMRKS